MEENQQRLSMKRKDFDRVNNEFSDFSLSSPARKIRRLDADLPPIMEEEEVDMAMQETVPEEIESSPPVNEERSIVLFKPLHSHHRPGNLFVDRNLISGFKNRFLQDVSIVDNDNKHYEDQTSNDCQAVVCWNPSSYSQSTRSFRQPRTLEITELDESGEDVVMDEATNETDAVDDSGSTGLAFPQQGQQLQEEHAYGFGLHQWQQQQQQNCMIPPQLPQVNTTHTPITWFG